MEISFLWKGDKPDYPPVDQIEESISFGLRHLGESRGPKPATLTVHLSMDKFSSSVGGVGYSPDEKPLFVSTFNLTTRLGTCDHHDAIQKPQS